MLYGNGTLGRWARLGMAGLLAAALAACGGGGGSGGTPLSGSGSGTGSGGTGTGSSGGTDTGSTVVAASSLLVRPAKTSIANSGADSVALVVTAVDASGNALSGATVNVAVNNNSVYTRSGTNVTGTDGTVSGAITLGSDKSNRLITYTATSGTVTRSGTISVTGTAVTASAVPASPTPGQLVTLTVTVADSAGAGISGVAVAVSGVTGTTLPSQTTGSNGQTVFRFNAPSAVGTYPLSIDANNAATQTVNLAVANAGSSTVPVAVGPISAKSVIANPTVVAINTAGSSTNQSEVRALFLTSNNVTLPNVRVRFRVMSSALTGESLVSGNSTVYSDVTGVAKTSYVAPSVSSPTNGVLIRACYALDDTFNFDACFAQVNDVSGNPTGQYVETRLTAASSPVSLTIGSDNVISKSASGIFYLKTFEVQAVDSSGKYAAGVQLSAVVDIQGYWKGPTLVPGLASKTVTDFTTDDGRQYTWCVNEDTNRNNALDTGEDTNTDGEITPRKADVGMVISTLVTDSSGLAQFQLQYPQNVASWERVRITVTAGVTGTEGSASYVYQLRPAQADVDAGNGSFLVAPYGTANSCTTPN